MKQTALYEGSSGRNRCLICEPIETKKLTHVIYAQIFNIASCEQKRTKIIHLLCFL
jgi:hypothetical protein